MHGLGDPQLIHFFLTLSRSLIIGAKGHQVANFLDILHHLQKILIILAGQRITLGYIMLKPCGESCFIPVSFTSHNAYRLRQTP